MFLINIKNILDIKDKLDAMEIQLRKEVGVLDDKLNLCSSTINDLKEYLLSLKASYL